MAMTHVGSGLLCWMCLTIMTAEAATTHLSASHLSETPVVNFWNGNKTSARQEYEREVLIAVMDATMTDHGKWQLQEDLTDYPKASDEAAVFRKGYDLFVTVAGNPKLANEEKLVVPEPLMKGLLGYRLLIINSRDRQRFSAIDSAEQLQALRLGIPESWADATLFRQNGYQVVERGSFDDLFSRLAAGEFDYVAFGANEVEGVFANRAKRHGDFIIEPSLLLYYPFPLVFYVNPDRPRLAARIHEGMLAIQANGTLGGIFTRYYGDSVEKLGLHDRRLFTLDNPILPPDFTQTQPVLLRAMGQSVGK